jgi:hypothetical protein
VAAKLDGYLQLAAVTHPTPLLIWLPTPAREAHAREHLAQALRRLERPDLVPIATTTPAVAPAVNPVARPARVPGDDDAGELGWLPITLERRLPDHGRPHHAAGGRAGNATGPRCDLAELAARWPAAPGQSHAELVAPDHIRARTRTVELPAPDPVPPAPTPTTPAPTTPGPNPHAPLRPLNPHGAADRAADGAADGAADRAVRPAATGHGHPGWRRT